MEVVAEGVETLEQMSVLKSLGCEYAQGYFFSKPVDSAGILRTLLTAEANSYALPQASPKQLVGAVG
jgi:EAL domain-containing protein (putative c-di-GMP-specific phosphodiesterase class I)